MQPIPFGRYLLTERLALGGTAEIFKAKLVGIEGFEKTVVIKRILPHWSANANFVAMLVDEAKIMVRLGHERIVQVYELGREGDNYYIAMEYVPGTDLRHLTDQARRMHLSLKMQEAIFIVSEVLRGLDYIHKQKDEYGRNLQIVHRDISPQNILISTEGAIKIADFGIAHATSRSYETATGVLKGKFTYMSPEQARGAALDQRTDIFATGIILYELLLDKRLFAGGSDLEVLERVRQFNAEANLKSASLPKPLKIVLSRALQANPRERYSSAQDFWKDLTEVQRTLKFSYHSDSLAGRLKTIMGSKLPESEEDSAKIPSHQTSFLKQKESQPESGIALVTRAEVLGQAPSNTQFEATRSLEGIYVEPTDKQKPPLLPSQEIQHSTLRHRIKFITGVGTLFVALFFGFYYWNIAKKEEPSSTPQRNIVDKTTLPTLIEKVPQDPTPVTLNQFKPETTPASPAVKVPESSPLASQLKEKQKPPSEPRLAMKTTEKAKMIKPKESILKPSENIPKGQGILSVRAVPWGKISISGIVSGSERPVSKTVAYGNYQVSVAYKNLSGEWKTIARSVKVARASMICTAAFRPDGQGSISCN
jgi:serine/threonine protein kinase